MSSQHPKQPTESPTWYPRPDNWSGPPVLFHVNMKEAKFEILSDRGENPSLKQNDKSQLGGTPTRRRFRIKPFPKRPESYDLFGTASLFDVRDPIVKYVLHGPIIEGDYTQEERDAVKEQILASWRDDTFAEIERNRSEQNGGGGGDGHGDGDGDGWGDPEGDDVSENRKPALFIRICKVLWFLIKWSFYVIAFIPAVIFGIFVVAAYVFVFCREAIFGLSMFNLIAAVFQLPVAIGIWDDSVASVPIQYDTDGVRVDRSYNGYYGPPFHDLHGWWHWFPIYFIVSVCVFALSLFVCLTAKEGEDDVAHSAPLAPAIPTSNLYGEAEHDNFQNAVAALRSDEPLVNQPTYKD